MVSSIFLATLLRAPLVKGRIESRALPPVVFAAALEWPILQNRRGVFLRFEQDGLYRADEQAVLQVL